MPIEVGIWKLGETIESVQFTPMPSEEQLEETIAGDIGILDPSLLLIGRQVPTSFGKLIDLLAMDADGKLVVIELSIPWNREQTDSLTQGIIEAGPRYQFYMQRAYFGKSFCV